MLMPATARTKSMKLYRNWPLVHDAEMGLEMRRRVYVGSGWLVLPAELLNAVIDIL